MKKLFLIALIGSSFLISCKKVIDCRDSRAVNFNPEADRACDECCVYENINTIDTIYVSPNADGEIDPADLNNIELAFSGSWEGVAISPWIDPYMVELNFDIDGSYSGQCTDGTAVAFYYGTDSDSPKKVYDLTTTYNYNNQLAASGTIDIVFSAGTVNQDEILHVRFHDNLDSLQFDFIHHGVYGPVKFKLNRM